MAIHGGDQTLFVGREPELTNLKRILDVAAVGGGGLALISGDPGIGKTRLAEELAAEGAARGMPALTGHCREGPGLPAYLPFVEMLETLERHVPAETFRDVVGDAAGEMIRLLPGLERRWADIPPPVAFPPDQQRRYFFNSFADVLGRLSHSVPLMLILEDLQWADEASLLLLEHLAWRKSQARLVLVGTYRDIEVDSGSPLGRTLDELYRISDTRRVVLRPLGIAETATMLFALSGQRPPAAAVALIHKAGEGNPFFTQELFHHLSEEGILLDPAGGWRSAPTEVVTVPPGVRLVIERRLLRLNADVRQALSAAAVIGQSFNFAVLRELVEMADDALIEALENAERAHLVVEEPAMAEANFRFAHDLIRQTLTQGLSAPRRQSLHLRTADAMEKIYARDLSTHASDIANQLMLAGSSADADRLAHFLVLSGDRALAAVAFSDALRHFDNAFALLPARNTQDRADALFKRGLALRGMGAWDVALTSFRDALNEYERLGDVKSIGHLCAELGLQLFYARRFDECGEIVQRGLAVVGDAAGADRVQLLCLGGRLFSFAGDFERGGELIQQSIAAAEQLGDDRLLGVALFGSTMHHWAWVQPARALLRAERAIEITRAAGAPWDLADGVPFVQLAMVLAGRLNEVVGLGDEVEPLARRIGHYGALMVAGRSRLLVAITNGDLVAVENLASNDLALCKESGLPWAPDSYAWLGLVAFWRGQWESALAAFEEGRKHEGPGTVAGACWAANALVLAHMGDGPRCRAMMANRPLDFPISGRPSSVGAWTGFLMTTEALVLLGANDEAAARYDLVLETLAAGNMLRGYDNRLIHAVAGLAAAAGERWDLAEDHFRKALTLADALPHQLDQAEIRRLYAFTLMTRGAPGDGPIARNLISEASARYQLIGMPRHQHLCQTLLAQLGQRPAGRATPVSRRDRLTEREREVLTLVAAGLSSKEVAKELSLSVSTIQRHIANIYAKVGVRNRAEATAYALGHGVEPPHT